MSDPQRWLQLQASRRPETEALRHGSRALSFLQLNRAVDEAAATLLDHATAVLSQVVGDPLQAVIYALAAPRIGLAFHPLSAARPDPMAWKDRRSLAELPPEAVQLIISTSGSSGQAKAVMLRGCNLAAAIDASAQGLGLHPGDSWLCCLPLSAIGGISIAFRCVKAGARAVLLDRFEEEAVMAAIKAHGITHLSVVPAMLSRLMALQASPPPHLRAVLVGGAALSQSIAEQALDQGWPIRPTYGMSETASQIATCGSAQGWQPGLAGRPLAGFELDFAKDGRLRLRGPQLMAGYANPLMHPGLGLDPQGWLETGDLGRLDDFGRLWVTGRADDVLISGGVTLHPSEVEHLLAPCPGLGEAAVTARPDDVWGDLLVVFHTGTAKSQQVLTWCKANLPSALRPRQAVAIPALPLNGAKKLDRRALRALASSLQPA